MKKSLIALAAVAASGAAFAQSSVTLFGVVDTSVAYVKGNGSDNKGYGLDDNGIATSRLGFRGVEDLGNGLKAQFWLEGEVSPDDGGAAFNFKRRSSISLLGNFGEVRLGRFLTAGHDKASSYSVFSTIGLGGFQGWAAEEVRYNNMLAYYSPNFSGFTFGVNYAFDEKAGETISAPNSRTGRYVGLDATYANGPLSITGAVDQAEGDKVDLDKQRSYSLAASYDFGAFKLSGLAHQVKFSNIGLADEKFTSFALGATAPVGAAGLVKVQYAHYKFDDEKANQLSLGYEHNLSKRTALYGTYSYLKNNEEGTFVVKNGLGVVGVADKASHGIQVGVRHSF
ncbi:porin [Comamonas sp.]|uniref:porin n=1 Tax=Comamonas sp. TaxID=34028 RepID=UPI00390CB7D7